MSARVEHERVLRDDAVDAVGDHECVEVDALDDVGHDEQLGAAVHRSRCRHADGVDYGARRGLADGLLVSTAGAIPDQAGGSLDVDVSRSSLARRARPMINAVARRANDQECWRCGTLSDRSLGESRKAVDVPSHAGALRGSVQRRAGDGSDLQTVPLALSMPRPGESFVVGGGRGSDKQNQRRSEPASAGSLSHKRLRPITLSLTLRAHTQTSTDSELEFSPAPPELVCGCKAQE